MPLSYRHFLERFQLLLKTLITHCKVRIFSRGAELIDYQIQVTVFADCLNNIFLLKHITSIFEHELAGSLHHMSGLHLHQQGQLFDEGVSEKFPRAFLLDCLSDYLWIDDTHQFRMLFNLITIIECIQNCLINSNNHAHLLTIISSFIKHNLFFLSLICLLPQMQIQQLLLISSFQMIHRLIQLTSIFVLIDLCWQVQIQQSVFSNCYFGISYDSQWLVQACATYGSIYKFSGTNFTRLSYNLTTPIYIFNNFVYVSQNQFGNFFTVHNQPKITKFDQQGYTIVGTLPAGQQAVAKNGPTIAVRTSGTEAVVYKHNGNQYVQYGQALTVPSLCNIIMSNDGTFLTLDTNNQQYNFIDNGTGFSLKYSVNQTSQRHFINFDGSLFGIISNLSGKVRLSIYQSKNVDIFYCNITTDADYNDIVRAKFNRKGSQDYVTLTYPYTSFAKLSIFKDNGLSYIHYDTKIIFQPCSAIRFDFATGLTYFITHSIVGAYTMTIYLYCDTSCLTCDILGKCATCNIGSTLYNFECFTCNISSCSTCSANNVCFSCNSSFSLVANTSCVECSTNNCEYCNTTNICSACQTNFTVSQSGCVACNITKCKTCLTDNICSRCDVGFTLTSNSCLNSTANNPSNTSNVTLTIIIGSVTGAVILTAIAILIKVKLSSAATVVAEPLHNVSEIKITQLEEINQTKKGENTVQDFKQSKKMKNNTQDKKQNRSDKMKKGVQSRLQRKDVSFPNEVQFEDIG